MLRAVLWIWIRTKLKGRIWMRIKVISWVRIRIRIPINLQMTSQNVWNTSLFEPFFKGLSLYLEARIRIRIRIRIRFNVKCKNCKYTRQRKRMVTKIFPRERMHTLLPSLSLILSSMLSLSPSRCLMFSFIRAFSPSSSWASVNKSRDCRTGSELANCFRSYGIFPKKSGRESKFWFMWQEILLKFCEFRWSFPAPPWYNCWQLETLFSIPDIKFRTLLG